MEKTDLLSLWDKVFNIVKNKNLTSDRRNVLLMMLEDVIISINDYNCDKIKTISIDRHFKNWYDKYLFLIAEVTPNVDMFILSFDIVIETLESEIKIAEGVERFELAANLLKIKGLVEYQKKKWTEMP